MSALTALDLCAALALIESDLQEDMALLAAVREQPVNADLIPGLEGRIAVKRARAERFYAAWHAATKAHIARMAGAQ